jgi:hypothetical protein
VRGSQARLWEYADAGLWLGDAAGQCIAINPALRHLLGNLAAADFPTLAGGLSHLTDAYSQLRRGDAFTTRCTLRVSEGLFVPLRLSMVRLPDSRVLCTFLDASAEVAAQNDLDSIALAFASGVGEHLLDGLVLSLAMILPADYAFIGRLAGRARDQIQTASFCDRGMIAPSRTYSLAGAPCADVIEAKELCTFESGVARRFPGDKMLAQMGAQAYIGAPLTDSLGRVLGLMAIVNCRPLADALRAGRLLKIYASRASLEMERMLIDQRELSRAKTRAGAPGPRAIPDEARKPRPGIGSPRATAAGEG